MNNNEKETKVMRIIIIGVVMGSMPWFGNSTIG